MCTERTQSNEKFARHRRTPAKIIIINLNIMLPTSPMPKAYLCELPLFDLAFNDSLLRAQAGFPLCFLLILLDDRFLAGLDTGYGIAGPAGGARPFTR